MRYLAWIIPTLLLFSCNGPGQGEKAGKGNLSGDVIIFHAGSLSYPFQQIARDFESKNPGTKILLEAAGSIDCARKITDLHKACDLMASSDYKVIEKMLMPAHTDWFLPFAGNEMVIAYTSASNYHNEITQENWNDVLFYEDVRYGRSDPNADPCGYRTLMLMQLAGNFYGITGLEKKLSGKDQKYIRPKEVDLLALLDLHEIDYIFIYKSGAIQHGLEFLALPDEINLKDMERNEEYSQASVSIRGSSPEKMLEIKGEAISYAITQLKDSPNPVAAMAFLDFLLDSQQGMKIMAGAGHNSLLPVSDIGLGNIPENLKKHTKSINY
jgi:molybdate/tungstate transport system substrate-binding protein